MIIDSFLGFNEIELARFRIDYLWELTDKVIIGESRLTFSGNRKPLYFSEWLNTCPDLQGKVEVVELHLDNFDNNWSREFAARELLLDYLKQNFKNQRAVLSDLDEIPTKQQILDFKKVQTNVHFPMKTYYRKANFALRGQQHKSWNHGVMIYEYSTLSKNGGRFDQLPLLDSSEVGGHFSYLGMTQELISLKMKSFSHNDLATAHLDEPNFLNFCDVFGVDHLGRFQEPGMGIFEIVNIDSFPKLLQELYFHKPAWFHVTNTAIPYLFRVLASAAVSHSIKDIAGSFSAKQAISRMTTNTDWIFPSRLAIILQFGRKIWRKLALLTKRVSNK